MTEARHRLGASQCFELLFWLIFVANDALPMAYVTTPMHCAVPHGTAGRGDGRSRPTVARR